MGFLVAVGPFFGLGISLHFDVPILEIQLGPFIFMLGDVDAVTDDSED